MTRQDQHGNKRLLGLSFIFAVALIWVAASFVVQDIQGNGVSAAVLTFFANSLFAIYLPIYWLNLRLKERLAAARAKAEQERTSLMPSDAVPSHAMAEPLAGALQGEGSSKDATLDMTWRQLLRVALMVAPLWYLAQFTFNLSLAHTSVTSNTVLSSTSSLFTFLISVWLAWEAFTLKKLACIVVLITGTAVYTLGDTKSSAGNTLWGDMLVLVSAMLYASYTVCIRKYLSDDEHVPMTLFFGLTGLVICLGLGPLLLLAWLLGAPLGTLTWRTFGLVMAKGLLDNVLSDYLWARAILLVGPTVATAGLSMQVPIAVGLDMAIGSHPWMQKVGTALLTFGGTALILAGFFGINFSEQKEEEEREAMAGDGSLHEVASHCELEGLAGRAGSLPSPAPLSPALLREGPQLHDPEDEGLSATNGAVEEQDTQQLLAGAGATAEAAQPAAATKGGGGLGRLHGSGEGRQDAG